ncbi:MAG: UDP-N-acetylmuramoyl-L-alanyl-D-glutamate--2,6-diaminopimelate ligase, partial [Butyricicoccus sp.]|nr:UDP-N-acetylmuramoyl-L-alanyl-D-glutamate--2,6-diaminopimelate ligase [Butyricicoccus sp.]
MKLRELLHGIEIVSAAADLDCEIREVCYDSRAVQPGDLFVAVRGYATDGHKYISGALAKGAAAVVCEEAEDGVPAVIVANSRAALADIACNRFDHPSKKLTMVGVTGTNGKTTTTTLIKHILETQGAKVGLIGTNENIIGETVIPADRTTPESYELQALFARMVEAG